MPMPYQNIVSINISVPDQNRRRRLLPPDCWSESITEDRCCRYCGHHAAEHRAQALRYAKPQRNRRLPRYVTGMKILLCLTCAAKKETHHAVCLKTKPTPKFRAVIARRQ